MVTPTASKIADIVEDAKTDAVEAITSTFDLVLDRCESPIEKLFAAALIHPAVAREYDTLVSWLHPRSGLIEHCNAPPLAGIWAWQQVKIGPYRVDFMLDYEEWRGLPKLIVECDGHDFHERTKAQAERDKSRDRYLVGRGFRVVRFTGAEIYRDPFVAVHQAIQILLGIAS